jgi:thiamine pyrophosphokinase
MMGLLFVGGEGPARELLLPYLSEASFRIAADSGLDLAHELGETPDLIVGDMDSLSSSEQLAGYPREKIRVYPQDKDETDTEIGLRLFREMAYDRVVLVGGGGGRLDHLLAIVALFEREYHPALWITSQEQVEIVERTVEFPAFKGQLISLFPLSQRAESLESTGLKWELDGLIWNRGDAGISNRAVSSRIRISVGAGKLLMIKQLAANP